MRSSCASCSLPVQSPAAGGWDAARVAGLLREHGDGARGPAPTCWRARCATRRSARRFGTDDQSRWLLPALRETYRDLGLISAVFGSTEMERENRGSFNLVVELGSPVQGEIILPPGESGSFTAADVSHEPPHLRDQLPLYEAFDYRRQPFAPEELEPPVTTKTIPVVRSHT